MDSASQILAVLDRCAADSSFPALDNAHVYLAAARLSAYRSTADWAIAIEVFGFSPRAGLPDLAVTAFASRLRDRNPPSKYRSDEAYQSYLSRHPHDDSRYFFPLDEGPWIDEEIVADDPGLDVLVRGRAVPLPPRAAYAQYGIELEDTHQVLVFELCRYLAATARDSVLATRDERRVSVFPSMEQVLQLDDWQHPDVAAGERPSDNQTFQQIAELLSTGELDRYRPTAPPNTHWKHWPEGGRL